jgi:hypothetical protein
MATPSTPIRKAANINVSPVGNQGNKAQSDILPHHRVAQPFGSVDKSEYKHPPAPVDPNTVPVNDKDAGNGQGSLRSAPKSRNSKIFRMPNGGLSAD